jgi:plastocyanin
MVAFSSSALISAAVATLYISGAASAPTPSTNEPAAVVARAPGVTHTVVAGLGGLHFDPENVVANIGDIVEYHYLPKNHSVAQSSFGKPCVPINGNAFFSGFMPTPSGQNVSCSASSPPSAPAALFKKRPC